MIKNNLPESVSTIDGAVDYAHQYGFPLQVKSTYVLGGWCRKVSALRELKDIAAEGLKLSPIGEIEISRPEE